MIKLMLCYWNVVNTTKNNMIRLHSDLTLPQFDGKLKKKKADDNARILWINGNNTVALK